MQTWQPGDIAAVIKATKIPQRRKTSSMLNGILNIVHMKPHLICTITVLHASLAAEQARISVI